MSSAWEWVSAHPLKALLLLSAFLLLSGNWILPLMDRDEPRFAEASREMAQRHDLVIPWFNGQYRFDKPPLIYWCQIGCYRCFGQNAFAARLPSAFFAAATGLVLFFWGSRLGNQQAGLNAGLMLITCLQFLIHGRLAVADMPMVFFVTMAVWSGWELTRPRSTPATGWWWIFYLSLGLGFLAKGPVAWLPLGGLLVVRWLRPNEFRLSFSMTFLGLLVALVVIGLWGIPALVATQGQFLSVGIGHHVIYRSFGIMEGHGGPGWLGFILTIPLYFLTFFFSFFPWAFRVPGTLKTWWPERTSDPLGWYLLVQALLVFAVFTLVRTKLPHYTLPAFPLIALWLALRISSTPDHQPWLRCWLLGMCALTALVTLAGFWAARPYFVGAALWHQAAALCSAETQVATVEFDEPSLVWEFRKGVTNYVQHLTMAQGEAFLQRPGSRVLILPTRQFEIQLKPVVTNMIILNATGIDTARFRRIALTALIK